MARQARFCAVSRSVWIAVVGAHALQMRKYHVSVEAVAVRGCVRKHRVSNLVAVVSLKRCSASGALLLVAHDARIGRRTCHVQSIAGCYRLWRSASAIASVTSDAPSLGATRAKTVGTARPMMAPSRSATGATTTSARSRATARTTA